MSTCSEQLMSRHKGAVLLNNKAFLHSHSVSTNGMSCQFCGKQFNRSYNLRRHEKNTVHYAEQERNVSQTDSDGQERDFQDDVSTTSTHGSEISTDNETEEEMDPWIPLIEEAKQSKEVI